MKFAFLLRVLTRSYPTLIVTFQVKNGNPSGFKIHCRPIRMSFQDKTHFNILVNLQEVYILLDFIAFIQG